MATAPKPRIKVTPETAKVGEIVEIKTLITHVMETGQRKDPDGKPIPRQLLNTFICRFADKEVFRAELQPGISANPYIAFYMKVPSPGEFEFTWLDDDGSKIVHRMKFNVTS